MTARLLPNLLLQFVQSVGQLLRLIASGFCEESRAYKTKTNPPGTAGPEAVKKQNASDHRGEQKHKTDLLTWLHIDLSTVCVFDVARRDRSGLDGAGWPEFRVPGPASSDKHWEVLQTTV
ncbi:hypothetical protein J6590_025710 [Homalodisca vitripennis]|nr:hypothetical protein J6590_025710 [Homalodisca vitripennis]